MRLRSCGTQLSAEPLRLDDVHVQWHLQPQTLRDFQSREMPNILLIQDRRLAGPPSTPASPNVVRAAAELPPEMKALVVDFAKEYKSWDAEQRTRAAAAFQGLITSGNSQIRSPQKVDKVKGRPKGAKNKDRRPASSTQRDPSGFEHAAAARGSKAPRKCGECKVTGHDRRSCPTLNGRGLAQPESGGLSDEKEDGDSEFDSCAFICCLVTFSSPRSCWTAKTSPPPEHLRCIGEFSLGNAESDCIRIKRASGCIYLCRSTGCTDLSRGNPVG